MSSTVSIASDGQWRGILGSSTITVADFYADWCGPCKVIAPTFESLSTKYAKPGKITFCKVNVDSQQSIASAHSVTAMPTFIIFKGASEHQRVRGADPRALTDAVEKAVKLASTAAPGASFHTPGRTLGAAAGGGAAAAAAPSRGGAGGGQTLGGRRRSSFSLFSFFNAVFTFFGLYVASLFSFDPYKAAESSDFNVNRPRAPPKPIAVPGAARPSGGKPQSRSNARTFTTTKPRSEDVQPDPQPSSPEDIEVVVRQARRAFGNTLPKDYLNEEEYKLYKRLYGAPLRETHPDDVGMPTEEIVPLDDAEDPSKRILLRDTEEGGVEEVAYYPDSPPPPPVDAEEADIPDAASPEALATVDELPSDAGLIYVNAVAKSQREYDALVKLQKDFERANLRRAEEKAAEEEEEEEEINEGEEEEQDDEYEDEGEPDATFGAGERVHGYTKIGRWRTYPTTLHLPKVNFVTPITELLDRTDIKHVKEAAEKAFGGPGLPNSVATPASKRNVPQVGVAMEAGAHRMGEIEADAYIATNLPGMYASTMSVLVEIRKRLGTDWMRNLMMRNNGEGPRVLDIGTGGGGLAAWQEVLKAEWETLDGSFVKEGFEPPGKKTVIVGSDHLRHRVSRFLQNTTFLPRLPDYLHSGDHPERLEGGEASLPRKEFDIVIASHLLMPLKEGFKREALIDNLWEMLSPDGGILIILEKGHPRGFEAVADVRSRLLNEFIIPPRTSCSEKKPKLETIEPEVRRVREEGSIIAPCTNHQACPMYLTPGLSAGRKDFCRFSQRFIRPPFLQRVLGATHRNHEDIEFSFVAIQRGSSSSDSSPPAPGSPSSPFKYSSPSLPKKKNIINIPEQAFKGYETATEPPNPLSLPRNIMPPLKRHGHVTLDLCTPAGTIERWTIPKSFSKQAYHDARKTQWGDLWALGAKTRVVRPIRLGRAAAADAATAGASINSNKKGVKVVPNDGGVRSRAARSGGNKQRVIQLNADERGIYSALENNGRVRGDGPEERRTRGGKRRKAKNLLEDLQRDQ
ncbi:37S ribosomal protein S22 [Diatrype stigma]|uniref:37S ribosomal protein S22 n=1 Tax=Diatrype stigma TaxID=117547 RepID=A0AAN9UFV2_9PEZI